MSQPERRFHLNEDEIRAVYRQGEDAVVSLVTQLLERLETVESRLEALEKRPRKTSRNSHQPPQAMVLANAPRAYGARVTGHPGANRVIRARP